MGVPRSWNGLGVPGEELWGMMVVWQEVTKVCRWSQVQQGVWTEEVEDDFVGVVKMGQVGEMERCAMARGGRVVWVCAVVGSMGGKSSGRVKWWRSAVGGVIVMVSNEEVVVVGGEGWVEL